MYRIVALRKESVDRNMPIIGTFRSTHKVALRKESVDRNFQVCTVTGRLFVALRKESVDRNGIVVHVIGHIYTSLSARRAWIEM